MSKNWKDEVVRLFEPASTLEEARVAIRVARVALSRVVEILGPVSFGTAEYTASSDALDLLQELPK